MNCLDIQIGLRCVVVVCFGADLVLQQQLLCKLPSFSTAMCDTTFTNKISKKVKKDVAKWRGSIGKFDPARPGRFPTKSSSILAGLMERRRWQNDLKEITKSTQAMDFYCYKLSNRYDNFFSYNESEELVDAYKRCVEAFKEHIEKEDQVRRDEFFSDIEYLNEFHFGIGNGFGGATDSTQPLDVDIPARMSAPMPTFYLSPFNVKQKEKYLAAPHLELPPAKRAKPPRRQDGMAYQ